MTFGFASGTDLAVGQLGAVGQVHFDEGVLRVRGRGGREGGREGGGEMTRHILFSFE